MGTAPVSIQSLTLQMHVDDDRGSRSDSAVLVSDVFNTLPLTRRFYARGHATCRLSARLPDGSFTLRREHNPGGFGNCILHLVPHLGMALMLGRAPSSDFRSSDLDLSIWFAKMLKVPLHHSGGDMRKMRCKKDTYMFAAEGKSHCISMRHFKKTNIPLAEHKDIVFAYNTRDPENFPGPGGPCHARCQARDFETDLANRRDVLSVTRKSPSKNDEIGSCLLRQFLDQPSAQLLAALTLPLLNMTSTDILLGMHIRYGDEFLEKEMNLSGKVKGLTFGMNKISQAKAFRHEFEYVSKLIKNIEARMPGRRVRIAIISDVPKGIEEATKIFGSRVLPMLPLDPVHSYFFQSLHSERARAQAAKLVSDWFLLALSDVLIRMTSSTFSLTASWLGLNSCVLDPYTHSSRSELLSAKGHKELQHCSDKLVGAVR